MSYTAEELLSLTEEFEKTAADSLVKIAKAKEKKDKNPKGKKKFPFWLNKKKNTNDNSSDGTDGEGGSDCGDAKDGKDKKKPPFWMKNKDMADAKDSKSDSKKSDSKKTDSKKTDSKKSDPKKSTKKKSSYYDELLNKFAEQGEWDYPENEKAFHHWLKTVVKNCDNNGLQIENAEDDQQMYQLFNTGKSTKEATSFILEQAGVEPSWKHNI